MGTAYNIPNCIAWYRATNDVFTDAGVTPALPGQPVYQWNDQSGDDNHLTQSNSDFQPLFNQPQTAATSSGPTTIDNYGYAIQLYQQSAQPSLLFDGGQLFFNMPSSIALTSAGCTVLMCTRGPNFSPVSFGTNGTNSINYGWVTPQHMAIRSNGLQKFPASTFLPSLAPIVHGFRCSAASNQSRLYMGMNQSSNIAANCCNFSMTGGAVGQTLNANDLHMGNFNFLGEIYELLIFSVPLTDAQIQTLLANLHASNQLPPIANTQQVIFIGDLLTAGGSSVTPFTSSYPWLLCQQYAGALKPLVVAGLSEGLADQQSIVTSAILSLDQTAFTASLAIVCLGSEEVRTGQTAAQIAAALSSLCTSLRTAGFKVIIATITPRDSISGYTTANTTTLNTLNALIRASYLTYANTLADWAADSRLSDCTNTLYFSDHQNTTPAGDFIKASIVKSALDPLLPTTSPAPLTFASFYTPGHSYTGNFGSFVRS